MMEEREYPWPMRDWPGEPGEKPEWWDDSYSWHAYQRREEHIKRAKSAERETVQMEGRRYPLQPWPGPGPKPPVWDNDDAYSYSMRQRYIARRKARRKAAKEQARRRQDPWAEAERMELVVPEGRIFDCGDIPHYAVALADLDARVRLKNSRGWFVLAGGKAIEGAKFLMSTRPLRGGNSIPFEAIGPDAEKALEVVRAVFDEDRRERSKRHDAIRGWWEKQSIPVSATEDLQWLVSPKRIMRMGGLR